MDPDQKGVSQIDTLGGTQSLGVVSESGFYDTVVRSDKPQGKACTETLQSARPKYRDRGRQCAGRVGEVFAPQVCAKGVRHPLRGRCARAICPPLLAVCAALLREMRGRGGAPGERDG